MPVGLRAVGAYADGKVSLEVHVLAAGVCHFLGELAVQMILHPDIVFGLETVAAGAEFGVFRQPGGVVLDEALAGGCGEVGGAVVLEGLADAFHLCLEDFRIVQLGKGVKGSLLLEEGLVDGHSDFLQAHIERVQGKGRHGAVGV